MSVTAISVVMTVFVLKIHHVGPHPRRVPAWVRRWIIKGAGQLLRCEFNCGKMSKRDRPSLYNMSPAMHQHSGAGAYNNNPGSVGANLAALSPVPGGDFVHMERSNNEVCLRLVNSHTASPDLYQSQQQAMATTAFSSTDLQIDEFRGPDALERSMSPDRSRGGLGVGRRAGSPPSPVWRPRFEHGSGSGPNSPQMPHHQPPRVLVHQPSSTASEATRQRQSTERLLSEIVAFLRILIAKSDETESKNAMIDEWRQVAEVVDKFLFFVFLSATGCFVSYFLVFVPLLT